MFLSLAVLPVSLKYFAEGKLFWLIYIYVTPCVRNNLFLGEPGTHNGCNCWLLAFILTLLLCQSRAASRSWCVRVPSMHVFLQLACCDFICFLISCSGSTKCYRLLLFVILLLSCVVIGWFSCSYSKVIAVQF